MSDIEKQFWSLCEEANDFDDNNSDVILLEPYLLKILTFVKEHPEHEAMFKNCFIEIGTGKKSCVDWILLYCMRELRYPEVQEAVNEYFGELGGTKTGAGARLMNFVSYVNWVYDPSPWEDADFFKYHWEREHPGEPWPGNNHT